MSKEKKIYVLAYVDGYENALNFVEAYDEEHARDISRGKVVGTLEEFKDQVEQKLSKENNRVVSVTHFSR